MARSLSPFRRPARVLVPVLALAAGCYTTPRVRPAEDGPVRYREVLRASPPPASSDPSPDGSLDADSLVSLALARNPGLQALRARAAAEGALAGEAGALENPELRLRNLELDRIVDRTTRLEAAVRVPIERPGAASSRRDEARFGAEAEGAEVEVETRALAARVRLLHAEVLRAEALLAVSKEEAAYREEERRLLAARVAGGAATGLDAALSNLDRAELADEAAELAAEGEEALSDLRALAGLSGEAPLRLSGPPGGVDPAAGLPDRETLLDRALALRPEIARARARLARAEVRSWRARSERWPWLRFVEVAYEFSPVATPLTWAFALSADLPVFDSGGAAVDARDAELVSERSRYDAALASVASDLDRALARVASARARLAVLEGTLLPAAETAAAAAAEARAKGALDPVRALGLGASRLEARRRAVEARHALALALLAVRAAAGDAP